MANVSSDRQLDGLWIELTCGRRPADPVRVLAASVIRNGATLRCGAGGKRLAQPLGKLAHVAFVDILPTLRCSITGSLAGRRIGKTLSLRLLESRLLDQHALTLVSLSRPTEANDYRAEGRKLAGAAGQRRITAGEEDEVIEVGACEAERPFAFHSEKAPLRELAPAFCTG